MFPDKDPNLVLVRVYKLVTTMRVVGIEKSKAEIVQIIVHQLSDDYDGDKRSSLSLSNTTRAFVEHPIQRSYASRNVKELKKPQVPSAVAAAPRDPHSLSVGGFQQCHGGGSGGQRRVSPAGELDSSSCGPAGVAVRSNSSMAVGITNISSSSLCSSKRTISICHATSSVVPLIGSNAFVHRHNVHTSAEDQRLGLEGRGTAGRTPRGTKNNHLSQLLHRWAPYTSVRDAEGTDIWPASVGRHSGLRGTAPLVESMFISVVSVLRHAGPSRCSRMPTWSLRLAAAGAILREITMTAAAGV